MYHTILNLIQKKDAPEWAKGKFLDRLEKARQFFDLGTPPDGKKSKITDYNISISITRFHFRDRAMCLVY